MNDRTTGTMAFILHANAPASFNDHHQVRFPTVRGTWFDVDVETLPDGTAVVTLLGLDGRTHKLRGKIPLCGRTLRVHLSWTREHVLLRLEGQEVARVKAEERPQP